MILRNLRKENSKHHAESYSISWSLRPEIAFEKKKDIKNKWRLGEGTINDWKYLNKEDFDELYDNVTEEEKNELIQRNYAFFDLYIEYNVQDRLMKDISQVRKYAPHQVKSFASRYLSELNLFFENKLSKHQLEQFRSKYSLQLDIDQYLETGNVRSSNYRNQYLDHQNFFHEFVMLSRFQDYLNKLSQEGFTEPPQDADDNDEFSLEILWPEISGFKTGFTVFYKSKKSYYKEDAFINYHILNVSGFYSDVSLKAKIRGFFKGGFEILLDKLKKINNREEKRSILEGINSEIEELKYLVVDGEYIEEESEYNDRTVHRFQKFEKLVFNGDADERFIFNERSRSFIAKIMQEYPVAWLEAVDEMSRKIEHLINNIDLIGHSSYRPAYEIESLFDDVFVLESVAGMIQGTAFHLKGVGIITCDHCVRHQGGILEDLEIYRRDLKKVKVKVVKFHELMDIAILEIVGDPSGFLRDGLVSGNSDEVKRLDNLGVAGFPNYNLGDTGFFMAGIVTGFRPISGVMHILVSNHLVSGNSGGPALNESGSVIGIVVTGADSFAEVATTEKHGLIPINVLKALQWI